MNKLYTQLAGSDLKFSRFPFIKVLSLTSIAALLSSVSPVFSKNLSPREGVSTDIKAVSVVSPQSVISVYDEAPGTEETDAVNIAQLKSLQTYVNKSWNLSVNGKDAIAEEDSSVAIGPGASVSNINAVALGAHSQVTMNGGVALGVYSVADVSGSVIGYKALRKGISDDLGYVWKSTLGAVSVGNVSIMQSRQITGVAAGLEDTDAVNVAQLKSLQDYVDKGWQLSVNGKNAKAIAIDSMVDFAAGSSNLEITKGDKGNNIKFDLAKDITLGSVKAGENTLDAMGLKITGGPQITTEGIDTAGKKITGVAEGTNETDAVNFGQLQKIEQQVAASSFVQQDDTTRYITIGKNTDGDKIDITSTSGTSRIISGVADAKNNNDAVNKGQLDTSIKDINNEITNKYNKLTQNITHITQQVKDDALLWSESDNAFVAQHGEEKAKSKLKYLLNGDITAESTDAVNGSQLYSMGNNLAAYLSDGAGYDENGEWKAPTFTLKTVKEDGTAGEESYDTVEKALSAVGTSFTNIQNKITNEVTKEINKTKSDALLWSESDGAFVAQHGEGDKKAESKIMHLKAGDITAESTDAINGSQLYSVIHSLSAYFGGGAGYENGQWNAPTFYVSQFKNDGNGDNKKDYHDVAAAFEGVNGSLSDINERINNVAKDVSSSGLNWNEEEKAFDARHNGEPSKIKYVADGNLSKDSKEAVNGSQLFETNNRVTQVENRVNNIDQKVENIENTVTNGVVKYDKNEKGDKINKVTLAGVSESDPVVLDNVAAGDLSKDSKQAVNGSQLWETNQKMDVVLDKAKEYTDERFNDIINHQMGDVINEAKSYTDMKFDALNYSIEGARKEARQAAAIGIAVANLRYNETPGKLSVGFGTGLWRNKSAFAFGAGYTSESGSVLSNVSVTNSGGHWGIGAGFNMTLN
ncbi:Vomp family autotransporter [Bartonella krasnovii]|uniref:Vomp family autotransporter n=1 Tax=Bartonella krasnovii TaxID=2267275 RepID=A0ABY3VZP6_9HYPH|nr:Vomp family autotransporter [Bartonella krasnovii]UNF29242.1 Vomp family autotransporter [Bartonella krasnovii]UNF37215.1 Vomp family autotransporter [Bartonella krasnovii]UNF38913.1 Vomp family autotransporter [Bartonella krasnovii]UNF47147.1 Vomp family autotransporter [Bartonella krasnovii]UNF50451.1 Vomp family autotransporter [Bartonella krasnovii]